MPVSSDASGASLPRARVVAAYASGWKRVWRAPSVTVGIVLVTLLLTQPFSIAFGGSFFGEVLRQEAAGQHLTVGWIDELVTQVNGLAFTHEFLAFFAARAIVSSLAETAGLPLEFLGPVAAYVVVWIFLTGGILDRLARGRPVRTAAFFAACGGFFLRLLRLGILAGAAYWALFWWLRPMLFGTVDERLTRAETDPVVLRAALSVVIVGAFATVGMIADFAKVRAVVEDRRSMLGALAASIRFVGRRVGRVIALWLVHVLVVAAITGAWYSVASYPDARNWSALLLAQLYLLFRLWAKLALLGAQTAFFQGELAHATYTAAPLPIWPDSPSAEAIDNFLERR